MIPCQYDEVGDFSEGLAAVKDADHNGKGEQWAYIDTKGEIQIDFTPMKRRKAEEYWQGNSMTEWLCIQGIVLYYGYEGRDDLLRGLTLFY